MYSLIMVFFKSLLKLIKHLKPVFYFSKSIVGDLPGTGQKTCTA